MIKYVIAILIFGLASSLSAQSDRSAYRANQKILDKNHGGIGLEILKPSFGNRIETENNWIGFNILSDIFETRLSFGEVHISEPEPLIGFGDDLPPPRYEGRYAYGGSFSLGLNTPISSIRIGAQRSSTFVFRAHPTFSFFAGGTTFIEKNDRSRKDSYYFMGTGMGFRLRLPLLTIEPNISVCAGIPTGTNFDATKWWSVQSGIIFRFDARKQLLDPKLVSVPSTSYSISNYRSSSSQSVHYRNDGTKVTSTTTYSSADVSVSSGSIGVQDIGALGEVGIKYSINNFKSRGYIPPGRLVGVNFTVRGGPLLLGYNLEFGEVGHGTELSKPEKWARKVSEGESRGAGSFQAFQTYFDIGFDASPALLSMLGVVMQSSDATSYFSIVAGYSIGYAGMSNQTFDNESSSLQFYGNEPDAEATERTDPRLSDGGYAGGFFLGAEVGVVSFRIQRMRYRNAPLANNTWYSLAYHIPLGRGKK